MNSEKYTNLWDYIDSIRYGFDTTEPKPTEPEKKNDGVEIKNTKEFSTIDIDLPGYKKSGIKITVENKILSVRVEGYRGNKTYKYTLTPIANIENIDSKFEDGVLYIKIPVVEAAKPKAVEIKVN